MAPSTHAGTTVGASWAGGESRARSGQVSASTQVRGAERGAEQDGALGALGPLGLQEMGNCSALPERSCGSFVLQTRLGLFRFPIPLQRKTERETVSQAELDRLTLNRDVVLPFRDQSLPA